VGSGNRLKDSGDTLENSVRYPLNLRHDWGGQGSDIEGNISLYILIYPYISLKASFAV